MIGRSGERGSGISVLAARHDDDDDICDEHFIYVSHIAVSGYGTHTNGYKYSI